jgi:hypothetical protein
METTKTLFEKGKLEEVVAEKMGYVNWKSSAWERVDGQQGFVERRQFSYNLNRQISQFGSKVSCIQQRTIAENMKSCVFDEVFTLHDVPFGDHFQVPLSCHGWPFYYSRGHRLYSSNLRKCAK